MRKILMTGITGLVGSSFATELLRRDKDIRIIALTRGQGNKNAHTRTAEAIREQCDFDGCLPLYNNIISRIETIHYNMENQLSGLTTESLRDIDTVFHCAADVNLGKDPYGKTYICNYQGTKNILKIATTLGVREIHQVSTAYVAGKAEGLVMEDGLVPNAEFNNAYEKSKYNAEQLVRSSGIKFSIYRPSIVVGRISDGKIRKPLAFYRMLGFLAQQKKNMCSKIHQNPNQSLAINVRMKAKQSDSIYFVPIDYVQKTITSLFKIPASGKTYHITGKGPASLKNIQNVVSDVLKITGLQTVETIDNITIRERAIDRFIGDLLPYFSTNITFDISNVISALGESDLNWKINEKELYTIIREYYNNEFPEVL